jgi:hypothetical protein
MAHGAALQTKPLLAALGAFATVAGVGYFVAAAGAGALQNATKGPLKVTLRDGLSIHHRFIPRSNNPLSCSRMLSARFPLQEHRVATQ